MKLLTYFIASMFISALYAEEYIATPIQITPEHKSEVRTLRPNFTWHSVENAIYYGIQITTDVTFLNISAVSDLDRGFISDTSIIPEFSLHADTLYFWRVRARTLQQTSEWSDIHYIKTPKTGNIFEKNYKNKIDIECFPNPVTSIANIKINLNKYAQADLYLFDNNGRLVEKLCTIQNNFDADYEQISMNFNKYPPGPYNIFCITSNSEVLAIISVTAI